MLHILIGIVELKPIEFINSTKLAYIYYIQFEKQTNSMLLVVLRKYSMLAHYNDNVNNYKLCYNVFPIVRNNDMKQ